MQQYVHAEPDPDVIVKIGDRWMRDVILEVPDEWSRMIHQGYMCLQCYQRFREPYPEVCTLPGCGYRVRENQVRDFDHAYRGEAANDVPTVEETIEKSRRLLRERDIWLPGGA